MAAVVRAVEDRPPDFLAAGFVEAGLAEAGFDAVDLAAGFFAAGFAVRGVAGRRAAPDARPFDRGVLPGDEGRRFVGTGRLCPRRTAEHDRRPRRAAARCVSPG
ncbi:hypothetical protein [Paraoerskovia marina]|uniref:hypothetical protein n=1 Tax=Paraoerskovia marina TaxID=545619 RepID=UPI0005BD8604|nr:hypothetical protein [Paraoerskovia marina]